MENLWGALEDYQNDQAEEDVQVKEKKKKKVPHKKQLAKAAEEARLKIIAQKTEYLRATKARVQDEWEMNHKKAEIFESEFLERAENLQRSLERILEINETWANFLEERRKEDEWKWYLKCDGLPNPSSVSQMNTYKFVRKEMDTNCQMSYCIQKTEEVMQLLRGLEDVIDDPGPDPPPYFLKDMKELRTEVRDLLQQQINTTTFNLFSRIETDMVAVNMTTSRYYASCPYFRMSLWAELIMPIPSSKSDDVRNPLKVTFEDIQVMVTIPVSILDIQKVMRAMWLNYDHWSDKCRTYECPKLPEFYNQSMFDLYMMEYEWKVEIMKHRELQEATTKRKVAALPQEPTLSQEILAWDSEPQKTLSDEVIHRECEEEDNLGRQVKAILNEFEVNLRERTFLGELLLLEILHQPPQSECLRVKHCVTLRSEPPRLKPIDYYFKYPPPQSEVEEKQEEEKTHKKSKITQLEEDKKKLFAVRLLAPTSVLWFEQPQLACWDPGHGYWSVEDIHFVEFDEEEEDIKFKASRLGLFGFHVSRFCNIPYEDWLFEPGTEETGISFHLKTSKTNLHFTIKAGQVSLDKMDYAPSKTMNWILGKPYPPGELLKILKSGGLDILPGPDAMEYLEGWQSKNVVVERFVYQVFGLFSKSFRFKRSKFNQEVARGNLVFQAQEIYPGHQVDFCLIQTTMCKAYVLNVTEESEEYSSKEASHMQKAVDLHDLLYQNSTRQARRLTESTCTHLIQTVKEFLSLVRPISFS